MTQTTTTNRAVQTACMLMVMFAVINAQYFPYTYNATSAFSLSWAFSADYSTITMQVTLFQQGWVGIGINNGTNTLLNNADFIIASYTSSGQFLSVDDRVSLSGATPSLDTSSGCVDNLISHSAAQVLSQNNTIESTFTFQRLLNTNDPCDVPIINGTMNFSYIYGTSNAVDFSSTYSIGSFSLDLFTHTNVKTSNLAAYHGTIMVLAFGFLMTIACFLPRYLKHFWWWFPLHIFLQVTAILLALTGMVIAFFVVEKNFSSFHSIFAYPTLVLMIISPALGIASHFMWKPTRSRVPIFPDFLHWWIGRATLIVSYASILTGMIFLQVPYIFPAAFVFVLCIYFIIFVFLEFWKIMDLGIIGYISLREPKHSSTHETEMDKLLD